MTLITILKEAEKLAIPSKKEKSKILSLVKEVLHKVNSELKKQKIAAKAVVGGSVAKGTWLPGISDIDFFIVFNYDLYNALSAELSNFAEKVLKKVFQKITKLHGSRDYFAVKYKGYNLEFIPVLDISGGQKAKNIIDYSPLHVKWVLKKAKTKNDIRLAKQFLKAAGVYGAESYIAGFSGHVVDLLVSYYGTFEKFVKAVANWPNKVIIDLSGKYKNDEEILQTLNPSKIIGPLILVDPIEPERNAAAAVSQEKFGLLKDTCKNFLKNPSIEFFKEKSFTLKSLVAKKGKQSLIVFEVKIPTGKTDIVGAKMKSLFEILQKRFVEEDFKINQAGWYFAKITKFWFYFDKKPLPGKKLHFGPPINADKKYILAFKRKWKGYKIKTFQKLYAVEIKRKYTKVEQLAKDLAKEFKLKLFLA
jgi:tRNA nucleotidyltransferase (CCA-adding enzyme)